MSKIVCGNVYLPLRKMPSHKSEMVSQALFGECIRVVDEVPEWIKIETEHDGYSGWTDKNHTILYEHEEGSKSYVLNDTLECTIDEYTHLVIGPGSEIYEPDFNKGIFRLGKKIFRIKTGVDEKIIKPEAEIHETALRFLNTPYLWGGRSIHGIDCSGFVQLVYKIHGINIPRDSGKQAEAGKEAGFIKDAKPGDLAFFDDGRGNIIHTGMIIPGGRIIHASGWVRIDAVDHHGIFRLDKKIYSHRLRLIKRFMNHKD